MLIENGVVTATVKGTGTVFEVTHVHILRQPPVITLRLTGRDPELFSVKWFVGVPVTLIQQLLACGVQIQDGTT